MTNITVFYLARYGTWVVIADGNQPGDPRFIMHNPRFDGKPWTRDQAVETARRIYGTEATVIVRDAEEQKALFN